MNIRKQLQGPARRFLLVASFLFSMAVVFPAFVRASGVTQPFDAWTIRNPLPTGNNLFAISYGMPVAGNPNFVATGQAGTILTSPNGSNWVNRVSGTNADLNGVAWGTNSSGNALLVAVGSEAATGISTMLVSADGFNWSPVNPGATNSLYAVAYGQDNAGAPLFAAVGGAGRILVSGDGTNWTAKTSGATNDLYGVAYGNPAGAATFVAVGLHINPDSTSSGIFVSSADGGATWTTNMIFPPNNIFQAVTYVSGDGFVAVGSSGSIYTSADGVNNWQLRTSGTLNQLNALAYGNGELLAVGGGGIGLSSTDGRTWGAVNTTVNAVLRGAACGNGTFVVVGNAGINLYTPDLTTWTVSRFRVVTTTLNGVAYGSNNYVAVGGVEGSPGVVVTSSNATFWVNQPVLTNGSMFAVTYGTNSSGSPLFVAVGNPPTNNASAYILVSGDAANWTSFYPDLTAGTLSGIVCGRDASGPLFVAVTDFAKVLTSADGTNWTTHAASASHMNGVTYGGGRFVAVGAQAAEVSTDGVNWSAGAGVGTATLNGVAFGNGLFVACGGAGSAGQAYVSADGTNWTLAATAPFSSPLNDITFARGTFVTVGQLQTVNGETAGVFTSADGTNWVAHDCGAAGSLLGITYGNGDVSQFVAVGGSALIVGATFSVTTPITYSPLAGAQLTARDLPFTRVISIERSTNLLNWTSLTNFTLGRGVPALQISDPSATNHPYSFYSIGFR